MSFKLYGWIVCLLAGAICSQLAFSASYAINPGDRLQVDVWNEETLSREVLVRPDGIISLPIAGEIDTNKASPSQVADRISKALDKYMKDAPRVVVSLISVDGNKIYVIGKVERPGEYIINSDTDVMQALALAGGLNAYAAENDIRILRRRPDGKQVSIPFRYARVKGGEDLDSNVILHSRDLVVVP
ncbi:MAG: polysaccharide biosynthesis/export family protein [Halioglobus sp.]